MEINDHANEVLRTASSTFNPEHVSVDLLHGAIGAAGEAGELLDAVKRAMFYGLELNRVNAIEEIGDAYWYLALACRGLGIQPTEALSKNSAKLRARYPDQFTTELAVNRDLVNEDKALKGVA